MTFGQRLKLLIKHYRYTQDEFAGIIGTSKTNLFNYFSDKTKPNIEVVAKLKKHFPDMDIEWLITGERKMLLNDDLEEAKQTKEAKEPKSLYGFKEIIKEKEKRIAVLEELVKIQRETIKRLEGKII